MRVNIICEVLKRGLERRVFVVTYAMHTQYNRSSSHPSSNFFKDIFAHTHINIFKSICKAAAAVAANSDTHTTKIDINDIDGGSNSNDGVNSI